MTSKALKLTLYRVTLLDFQAVDNTAGGAHCSLLTLLLFQTYITVCRVGHLGVMQQIHRVHIYRIPIVFSIIARSDSAREKTHSFWFKKKIAPACYELLNKSLEVYP